jgi:hypothetical protein
LYGVRKIRSDQKVGGGTIVDQTVLSIDDADFSIQRVIQGMLPSIQGATRSMKITFGQATESVGVSGVKIGIVFYPEGTAPKMKTVVNLQPYDNNNRGIM